MQRKDDMIYLIFAFRSRTQSIRFSGELKAAGVVNTLVSTPREVSVGCGLSVKIGESAIGVAAAKLHTLELNTFIGAFRVTHIGSEKHVERITV